VGEIDGMDGNKMQISYTFKAEGATLTGRAVVYCT